MGSIPAIGGPKVNYFKRPHEWNKGQSHMIISVAEERDLTLFNIPSL